MELDSPLELDSRDEENLWKFQIFTAHYITLRLILHV